MEEAAEPVLRDVAGQGSMAEESLYGSVQWEVAFLASPVVEGKGALMIRLQQWAVGAVVPVCSVSP